MSIVVRRLCRNLQKEYRINLVAGADGLDNKVSWVHILEDCEVADFLHGNEVVLTTGIGNLANDTTLMEFVKKLHVSNASAIMINIGPYIKSVPKEIIEYCNRVKIPLYTVPWEVKLVDLTRQFCRMLIDSEEREKSVTSLVKDYIFKPDLRDKVYSELTRNGFAPHLNYCVIFSAILKDKTICMENTDKEMLHAHLERELNKITQSYCIFLYNNMYVSVLAGVNTQTIREFAGILHKKNVGDDKNIVVSVSNNRESLVEMPKNFTLAERSFKLAKHLNEQQLFFDDLGIYKLLLSISDRELMENYVEEVLGTLIEYDEGNGTDFVDFMKICIENNGNIQQMANSMYVHRNTVHYKINKIREISGINLSESEDMMKVMICLLIMQL
jgi:hypothetical protein